jgi:NAD(P)H dehydrogenase (quinone)
MPERIVWLAVAMALVAGPAAVGGAESPDQAAATPQGGAAVNRTGPGPRVLIAYLSKTGSTETMARSVAEGAKSVAGATVTVKAIADVKNDDLLNADAIIVGTPVYNGGAAAEVKQFMERWPFGRLRDKVGAAFCSAGGTSTGEELALMDIISSMLVFQFVIVGGDSWEAAFGASAITEEAKANERRVVDDVARVKARGLGARVAKVAMLLKGTSR